MLGHREQACIDAGKCHKRCLCVDAEPSHCQACGEPFEMSNARWDAGGGTLCWGCTGYPFCSCPTSHKGDCTEETMKPTKGPSHDR